MQAQGTAEVPPYIRVNVIHGESWIVNTLYSDLFTELTRFPQKTYRFERESLTPRDEFIVSFCEHAEKLKRRFSPENTIRSLIELNVSDRMVRRIAYEIWEHGGEIGGNPKMWTKVKRIRESQITDEMERWVESKLKNNPQAAEGLYYNIPSIRSRYGGAVDRDPYPVNCPVRERERRYFKMEAPLVLPFESREPRDNKTMTVA